MKKLDIKTKLELDCLIKDYCIPRNINPSDLLNYLISHIITTLLYTGTTPEMVGNIFKLLLEEYEEYYKVIAENRGQDGM